MAKKTWITVYEDYSGVYYRKVAQGLYHFVEYTDMDDACGRDNEGHPKYHVQLKEVDLNAIPRKQVDSALDSCGMEYRDRQMLPEEGIAEACQSYGAYAPMWEGSSNNLSKLLREARRQSRMLDDEAERYERLSRPVNAIGSSALEYMQGDLISPLARGVQQGDEKVSLVGKLYGVTPEAVASASTQPRVFQVNLQKLESEDPIAYTAGYMRGNAGGVLEANREELAPAYIKGYTDGMEVRHGAHSAPVGIQG